MIPTLIPPTIAMAPMKEGDPRIGHLLATSLADGASPLAVIVGFPTDEGVRRNGGRLGAQGGPGAIRKALYNLTPNVKYPEQFLSLIRRVRDVGDIPVTGNLEHDQEILGEFIGEQLRNETVPIILGGGHETAFGHFLGYVRAERPHRIINIDAHPDVRPLVDGRAHSGSPFYQALTHEGQLCLRYSVIGLLPQSTSEHHCRFIKENGGSYLFRDEVGRESLIHTLSERGESVMMTFDLDALEQSHAPGVSAPAVDGLDVTTWLTMAEQAGADSKVTSLDIVELNPNFDIDNRTAKIAAMTAWRFLTGLAQRYSDKGM